MSEEDARVIDLDKRKTGHAFSVWWKMCVFIDSHLRHARWEDDVALEKKRRVEGVRPCGLHDQDPKTAGKRRDENALQMGKQGLEKDREDV